LTIESISYLLKAYNCCDQRTYLHGRDKHNRVQKIRMKVNWRRYSAGYTELNENVQWIMDWKDVKEAILSWFKVLSRHLHGGAEENYEQPQSDCRSRFEPSTDRIRSTSSTFLGTVEEKKIIIIQYNSIHICLRVNLTAQKTITKLVRVRRTPRNTSKTVYIVVVK
jgi:hypothetical protein